VSDLVAAVKERVDVPTALAALGHECVAAGRRGPCGLHSGDNKSAFSTSRDGRRWTCFTRCGSGDVIDLTIRARGVGFREAVDFLAGIAGIAPGLRRSRLGLEREAAHRAVKRELAKQEQVQQYRERLREHAAKCVDFREALDDQDAVSDLLQRDPHDPGVKIALEELGDPWMRELMLAQEVDALEQLLREVQIYPARDLMQALSGDREDRPRDAVDERLREVGRVLEALADPSPETVLGLLRPGARPADVSAWRELVGWWHAGRAAA